MRRGSVEIRATRKLDDLSQVHDRYTLADMVNYGQVVPDENIGKSICILKIVEKVDNLRLYRYIEGRDWLI